ncbi:hypothetical protein EPN42_00200 [bacterium]|nr:MAG: hypothetical protein EPN42_00200 [bacterium]
MHRTHPYRHQRSRFVKNCSLFRVAVTTAALSALVVQPLVLTPAAADAPGVVKVGVTAPLSGPGAQSGLAVRTGMQLAVDQMNAKGGVTIDGKRVKVQAVFEDDQSNAASGVSAALKLLTQEKVDFLIGDAFRSDVTLAIMDLAPQFKVPIMSGEAVAGSISKKVAADPKKYANFWKGNLSSDSYAYSMSTAIEELVASGRLKVPSKTVAFISEDTEYGRTIAQLTGAAFEKAGWKVVDAETVALGSSDFYPQFNKFKSMDPGLVMGTFTSADSGVALVKQFHELGIHAALAGIYFPNRPEFLSGAQKSADGLVWATLQYDPVHNKAQRAFAALVDNQAHQKATYDIAAGYDIMSVALAALQKAGSTDVAVVDKAMLGLNYKGLLGRYDFDAKDHTVKSGPEHMVWPVAQIVGGESFVIWPKNLATHAAVPQVWLQGK